MDELTYVQNKYGEFKKGILSRRIWWIYKLKWLMYVNDYIILIMKWRYK